MVTRRRSRKRSSRRGSKFPQAKVRDIAQGIARWLLFLYGSSGVVFSPSAWVRVAELLGCTVVEIHDVGGRRGVFQPGEWDDANCASGTIAYNTAYDEREQCLTIIHEISHYLQWRAQGSLFAEVATECGYDDDPRQLHHRIARMVEGLIAKQPD